MNVVFVGIGGMTGVGLMMAVLWKEVNTPLIMEDLRAHLCIEAMGV